MENYAVLALCVLICAVRRRGVSLCGVICLYYILYISSEIIFYDEISDHLFYLLQVSVDMTILSMCYILSMTDKSRVIICYMLVILSSLILDSIVAFGLITNVNFANDIYAIRQEISLYLDIIFAVLGASTNAMVRIDCTNFNFGADNDISDTGGKCLEAES